MTKTERDDLIRYLDNEAGPMPSKVNAAHESVQQYLSRGDIGHALLKTIEAEGYNGQVGVVLQTLRDKLAAITVDPEAPPELPPVTPPPTYTEAPVNPLPNDSKIRFFGPVSFDNPGRTVADGDGMFSFSDASGNVGYYGTVNGVVVIDGGSTPVAVKKGDVLTMAPQAQFGTRPKFSYSLNKYA